MIINLKFPKRKPKSIKMSEYVKKPKAALMLPPVLLLPATAQAASSTDAILKAFDPLLDLVQAMSYPVTFLVITGGMLFVIIGQRHRGLEMIKWAVVGYIGVQFAPGIMKILLQVGQAMRAVQQ